jgi:hypothetical protein
MAKNNHAVSLSLVSTASHRGSPLEERLNRRVLQTIRDRVVEIEKDPGIEDEYEFEIFGDTGPTTTAKKKKK